MKSAEQIIRDLLNATIEQIESSMDISSTATNAVTELAPKLIEAFAWHTIDRVDLYNLRAIPEGKKWGPRVVVMMNGRPAIAYWDPDQVHPNGDPVEAPAPYWRTMQKSAEWSRRATVTHFLRPYVPHA